MRGFHRRPEFEPATGRATGRRLRQGVSGSCCGRGREAPRSGRRPCRLAVGRRVDRVEAGPAGLIDAPSCQHRCGLRRARNRLPADHRGHGHHHSRRELLFHVMGALAQFERRLNAERSRAGIEAARRRGEHLGRPAPHPGRKSATPQIDSGEQSVSGMAKIIGVHRVTLHKALKRRA
jgi:hypothetical protein